MMARAPRLPLGCMVRQVQAAREAELAAKEAERQAAENRYAGARAES